MNEVEAEWPSGLRTGKRCEERDDRNENSAISH
jgi:hypothetical protein